MEFHGKCFTVPRSIIGAKPVQKPRPPIYLAAFAPAALQRTAALADGWMPIAIPLDTMTAMIAQLREFAAAAGRDPQTLGVVVGAHVSLSEKSLGMERGIFTGSEDQVKSDIEAVEKLSASEIFFVIFHEDSIKDLLAMMERFRSLA